VPLWTGAEDGGEANFGVVLTFSPLPGLPAPIVFDCEELDVLAEPELLEELAEDPQPAASNSAAQKTNVGAALLIGERTLA
jgi:hypothetical protein